jgi:dephospho-CoA kinase
MTTGAVTVALTGGIASGKSVATQRLTELGAVIIDYDLLARDAVAPGSTGLADIVQRWGPGMVEASGALNRPALAAIVFADPDEREALEAITHPEVGRLAALREKEALAAPRESHDPSPIIVHDIPLLVEGGYPEDRAKPFDVVVVVHAPLDVRLARLTGSRGLSEAEAQARISAQAPEIDRLTVADLILNGGGSPASLRAQVDDVWAKLVALPA